MTERPGPHESEFRSEQNRREPTNSERQWTDYVTDGLPGITGEYEDEPKAQNDSGDTSVSQPEEPTAEEQAWADSVLNPELVDFSRMEESGVGPSRQEEPTEEERAWADSVIDPRLFKYDLLDDPGNEHEERESSGDASPSTEEGTNPESDASSPESPSKE